MTKIYFEGNNGDDYIKIELLKDDTIHLEVGHCCVRMINHIVPVEFLIAILVKAVTIDSPVEAMRRVGWPKDYITELASKIKDKDYTKGGKL